MRRWTFVIWLCCVCSSVWCEAWPCDWCIARHLTNRIYNIYMCKCTVYYGFTFAVWIFHKHTVHTRNTARWCCAFASGHRCLVHNNLWETDIRCAHNRIRFVSAIESHKEHHRRALNWTTSRCANEIRIAHFRFAGMFEIWKFKSLKVMSKSCRRVLLGNFRAPQPTQRKFYANSNETRPCLYVCSQLNWTRIHVLFLTIFFYCFNLCALAVLDPFRDAHTSYIVCRKFKHFHNFHAGRLQRHTSTHDDATHAYRVYVW